MLHASVFLLVLEEWSCKTCAWKSTACTASQSLNRNGAIDLYDSLQRQRILHIDLRCNATEDHSHSRWLCRRRGLELPLPRFLLHALQSPPRLHLPLSVPQVGLLLSRLLQAIWHACSVCDGSAVRVVPPLATVRLLDGPSSGVDGGEKLSKTSDRCILHVDKLEDGRS